VGEEFEQESPPQRKLGRQAAELVDRERPLLLHPRPAGSVSLGNRHADSGSRVVANEALFHSVAEQGAKDGDVLAHGRLREQALGSPRILQRHEPAHERLDLARLDLRQTQPHQGVEVRDQAAFEHLPIGTTRRLAESVRSPALIAGDPFARVLAERDA
jgi:hypothetical protein